MTKGQLIERIKHATETHTDNIKDMAKYMRNMDSCYNAAIAHAITLSGSGIVDALNSIALILCEMLPKEE